MDPKITQTAASFSPQCLDALQHFTKTQQLPSVDCPPLTNFLNLLPSSPFSQVSFATASKIEQDVQEVFSLFNPLKTYFALPEAYDQKGHLNQYDLMRDTNNPLINLIVKVFNLNDLNQGNFLNPSYISMSVTADGDLKVAPLSSNHSVSYTQGNYPFLNFLFQKMAYIPNTLLGVPPSSNFDESSHQVLLDKTILKMDPTKEDFIYCDLQAYTANIISMSLTQKINHFFAQVFGGPYLACRLPKEGSFEAEKKPISYASPQIETNPFTDSFLYQTGQKIDSLEKIPVNEMEYELNQLKNNLLEHTFKLISKDLKDELHLITSLHVGKDQVYLEGKKPFSELQKLVRKREASKEDIAFLAALREGACRAIPQGTKEEYCLKRAFPKN